MIEGVRVYPLRKIPDERGCIFHMLRNDDSHFQQFGEIYFSLIYPGAIKAWHVHTTMSLNYACVSGMIKLVLHDMRDGSPTRGRTQEIFIGQENYSLVHIPPGVHNGFKAVGTTQALVANCSTHPHDPSEIKRLGPFDKTIGYDWSLKHG